ncbi:MAG: enoyl-CoA hydratase/isomerase family protein [Burkholderiales bacterium]
MTSLEIANGVAQLTLASPPVNALSEDLLDAVERSLDRLATRTDWSVLVLASSANVFCAGGDLHTMAGWMRQDDARSVVGAYAARVQRIGLRIESMPQVTIALCERSALGGGLELALACDLRVASSRAKFGLPEVRLGLLPGAGGTQRLTRLCGTASAMRMILSAEVISAEEAKQIGLVQWVFEPERFAPESQSIVARVASMPRHAQQASKSCIRLAHDHLAGYAAEVEALSELATTKQTLQLVEEFLAGAREPVEGR